jgi:hypothetical protein
MNKEVIKAMNKKETKIDKAIKWWRNNGYKVMRVILFPIWWGVCAKNKIHDYKYKRLEWSEEKANEILSYYIPRIAEWSKEDKCFYFADNGRGWSMKCHQKKIKLKDRAWWKKYTLCSGGEVRTYLVEKFELEGFTKEVGITYDCWTEVTFYLIEK